MERRLAAILAADVVGYSRQIGADEAGTLDRLRVLRTEVLEPLLAAHGGRLFKTMGDGFLAEFSSAVQALSCALAVQKQLASVTGGLQLRIDLHAGDVVVEGDDLLGDGVNVAARIEPLAEPGGIALSAQVREDAHGRLNIDAEDMGVQSLKNIARPVCVFRIAPPGATPAPASPALALPDKPSIAVLPFANMSGDNEQEYFADGVAEDIITELSRSRALFVIARNSSFTYRGKSVAIRQVGRELGVRYVLEGSVRRGGNRIRVTAQLVDAETGNHLWAERYDRDLADVFAVQDEITHAAIIAIGPTISDTEQRRATRKPVASLSAWEMCQLAQWHLARLTLADNTKAEALFRRASTIDPDFAPAWSGLSRAVCVSAVYYRARHIRDAARESEPYARRAMALDPDDPEANASLSQSLVLQGEIHGAAMSAARALTLNPNLARAHFYDGLTKMYFGEPSKGRDQMRQALRLNPREPANHSIRISICASYLQERDYTGCVDAARAVILEHNTIAGASRWLAASLAHLGRIVEARAVLDRALASPEAGLFRALVEDSPPVYRPEDHEHMLEGLRKAGWDG